jgi:hypothetical protein
MTRIWWIDTPVIAFGLAAFTALSVCSAQQAPAPAATPPPPTAATTPAGPVIEPDAVAALHRMGAYLRTLKAFSLQADTVIDEVTDDGMKLQFGGTVTMQARRPNGLRLAVNSDRKHRQFIFDGKTMTLYGDRTGYYATVPAPGTIKELLAAANEKYDLKMPLADLFAWGVDDTSEAAIKEAALIGPAQIGGALCDHVAVRQEGADWQVWIERGKTPLPRKLVITTTTEPAQPQYAVTMRWNVTPKFDAASFKFVPPKSAHRIPLASPDAAPAGK